MSHDLEKRLGRLEDIESIRLLRILYHEYINERQFGRICELFTDDAHVQILHVWKGTAEIDAGFRAIGRHRFLKQFPHSHRVTLNDDGLTASGRCDLEARYVRDGASLMVCGTYYEDYLRTAKGWRISRLECPLDFSVPVPWGWKDEDSSFLKPNGTAPDA
jgi:ketosteroid isomerase-like protein